MVELLVARIRSALYGGCFLFGAANFVLQRGFFGASFEALKVGCAATTFLNFVILLAHKVKVNPNL